MEIHKQSSVTARDFYRHGKQFLKASRNCFGKKSEEDGSYEIVVNSEFYQLPAPCVVNAAFSCEMFLKSILKDMNISYNSQKEGHNLYLLYKKLPMSIQVKIAKFCEPNENINSFEIMLKKHATDFVDIRYFIEQEGWTDMSPITMLTLAENLSVISYHILKLNQQEKSL